MCDIQRDIQSDIQRDIQRDIHEVIFGSLKFLELLYDIEGVLT